MTSPHVGAVFYICYTTTMSRSDVALHAISHVCLYVANMARSIVFYRDVLGLTPLPKLTTPNFFAFNAGGVIFGLEPNGSEKRRGKPRRKTPCSSSFTRTTCGSWNR